MTTTMNPPAQVPIPVPPRVITTKDLLYLKDALSWELNAFKKFHFFRPTNDQSAIETSVRQSRTNASTSLPKAADSPAGE